MSRFINFLFKKRFTCPIIIFILLSLIYPAGALNSNARIENIACYISNVSKSESPSKSIHVIAESTNEKRNSVLIDTETEYRFLYGVFGGGNKAYFANTINADKKDTIMCPILSSDYNYSFLYAESGFRNKKLPDSHYYRHEFYPINLMFQGEHRSLPGSFSFLYISESHANIMLDVLGLEHTIDNYESLLGSGLDLIMNNNTYTWIIEDIYFEEGVYYNDLHEAIGDFFFGYKEYPDGFNKQAVYFLKDSEYENKFFLDHISTTFKKDSITLRFLEKGLKDNELIYIFYNESNAISILLYCVTLGSLLCLLIFCHFNKCFKKISNIIIYLFALLIPWCIFKLISVFSKSLLFFSISTNYVYIIAIIVAELIIATSFVLSNYFGKEKRFENSHFEIDI